MSVGLLSEDVGFDLSGGVGVLQLRRAHKRNAVTGAMWRTMLIHLQAASRRSDVRVLVLQGSDGVFCAGADLSEVKHPDGTASSNFRDLVIRVLTAIASFPVPTVARIEGPCIGGGCSLALACDLRFAHSDATFQIPAVRHGIVYDEPSITRLVALVGPSHAARMIYSGARLDAHEAARIGLVDECGDELERLVRESVDAIASGDPGAVAGNRRLLQASACRAEAPSPTVCANDLP